MSPRVLPGCAGGRARRGVRPGNARGRFPPLRGRCRRRPGDCRQPAPPARARECRTRAADGTAFQRCSAISRGDASSRRASMLSSCMHDQWAQASAESLVGITFSRLESPPHGQWTPADRPRRAGMAAGQASSISKNGTIWSGPCTTNTARTERPIRFSGGVPARRLYINGPSASATATKTYGASGPNPAW